MGEKRGILWGVRLSVLLSLAGYALPVITSGGGDDTVSIFGYELLTLLPEYAREYGEDNRWIGVGLMAAWAAAMVAALALVLAFVFSFGKKSRYGVPGGLCELSVAINLSIFSVFHIISEVESLMDDFIEAFVDLGDIKFLNLGAGYYIILIAPVIAAALAWVGKIRSERHAITTPGKRLRTMSAALTSAAVVGCFCPMVGVGAGESMITLFGGTLAGVGAGLAGMSGKVAGGVLFWYVLAILGAVLAAALKKFPGRLGSLVPGAFSALGAVGLALMVRALGAGSVEHAYDLVDVSCRWGWWLAFCALTASAALNLAAPIADLPIPPATPHEDLIAHPSDTTPET